MNSHRSTFLGGLLTLGYGLIILLLASFLPTNVRGTIQTPAWRLVGKVASILGLCLVACLIFALFMTRLDGIPQELASPAIGRTATPGHLITVADDAADAASTSQTAGGVEASTIRTAYAAPGSYATEAAFTSDAARAVASSSDRYSAASVADATMIRVVSGYTRAASATGDAVALQGARTAAGRQREDILVRPATSC